MTGPSARTLLAGRPRQPDQRSCGAACLVVARAVVDERYADYVVSGGRFVAEVLGMHRRTTSLVSLAGRVQVPWPRLVGTPPWAVANHLSATGPRHVVRPRSRDALARLLQGLRDDRPVPVYVGSRRLPRHVVLALRVSEGTVWCYEPSSGAVVPVAVADLRAGRAPITGWTHWWWAVTPERRTPA